MHSRKAIIGQSEPPLDATDFFELRANKFEVGVDEKTDTNVLRSNFPLPKIGLYASGDIVGDAEFCTMPFSSRGEGEPGTHSRCEDDSPLSLVYGWARGRGLYSFPRAGFGFGLVNV